MLPSITCSRTLLGVFSRLSLTAPAQAARSFSYTSSRSYADLLDIPATPPLEPPLPADAYQKSAFEGDKFPKEGALRPHLNIKTNPNHGLYGFFRKTEGPNGETKYETIEVILPEGMEPGRSWSAAELRRKSFQDLHTLWYVLLRERNLWATQREEGRRLSIGIHALRGSTRSHVVRKSMARIKYILNERRLAYEGALKLHAEKREKILAKEAARKQREEQAKAREIAAAAAEAQPKVAEEGKAASLAAGGLFDNAQAAQGTGSPSDS
ncbi:unnamed protein product [Somion occarium]|uniref:Large ribosomal subunit protein uL29m n=1 Tax=Somion occarium TaxID=3059160 RepID=A0ABP1E1I7_9APHY